VVGKFLLHGLECYKDIQMKAYDTHDKYVEYWRDIEIWVTGRSRSLKMLLIDRSYTTYYWSAIVTIPYILHHFRYMTLSNIVTLKSRLRVTQSHLKWHHSIDRI